MPDILEQIKRTLDEQKLKYMLWQDEGRSVFQLAFSGLEVSFLILISYREKKSIMHLMAPKLAFIDKNHPNAINIYSKLLTWNYDNYYPKFSVDGRDGEIVCEAAVPLPKDGTFPSDALARVLMATIPLLFETLPDLIRMAYDRSTWGNSLVDEIFDEIVRGMAEDEHEEGNEDED